jgi:hypothetical protein
MVMGSFFRCNYPLTNIPTKPKRKGKIRGKPLFAKKSNGPYIHQGAVGVGYGVTDGIL